jgi:hypothetical protein
VCRHTHSYDVHPLRCATTDNRILRTVPSSSPVSPFHTHVLSAVRQKQNLFDAHACVSLFLPRSRHLSPYVQDRGSLVALHTQGPLHCSSRSSRGRKAGAFCGPSTTTSWTSRTCSSAPIHSRGSLHSAGHCDHALARGLVTLSAPSEPSRRSTSSARVVSSGRGRNTPLPTRAQASSSLFYHVRQRPE